MDPKGQKHANSADPDAQHWILGFDSKGIVLCDQADSTTWELGELLGVELSHLCAEDNLSDDSLHVGLVDDGGEPTGHVHVRLPTNTATGYRTVCCRVVDPYTFDTDPDPDQAF